MGVRKRKVSGVLKLEDFSTGNILTPADVKLIASSGEEAFFQQDGYFVFCGEPPVLVRVESEKYHGVEIKPKGGCADILRVALFEKTGNKNEAIQEEASGCCVHIGISIDRQDLFLGENAEKESNVLYISNIAMRDLTNAWLLLVSKNSGMEKPEAVYIQSSLGKGRYRTAGTLKAGWKAGECRLVPLKRVYTAKEGALCFKPPPDAGAVYCLSQGGEIKCYEAGEF